MSVEKKEKRKQKGKEKEINIDPIDQVDVNNVVLDPVFETNQRLQGLDVSVEDGSGRLATRLVPGWTGVVYFLVQNFEFFIL